MRIPRVLFKCFAYVGITILVGIAILWLLSWNTLRKHTIDSEITYQLIENKYGYLIDRAIDLYSIADPHELQKKSEKLVIESEKYSEVIQFSAQNPYTAHTSYLREFFYFGRLSFENTFFYKNSDIFVHDNIVRGYGIINSGERLSILKFAKQINHKDRAMDIYMLLDYSTILSQSHNKLMQPTADAAAD